MSSSFFIASPFSYDSTSIEVASTQVSDEKKQTYENLAVISPKDDKAGIMRDVHRDVMAGALVINGVNALELRKRDQFTTVQLEIYNMDEKTISSLTHDQIEQLMIKHSKEPTVNAEEKASIELEVRKIRGLPIEDAQKALLAYKTSLKEKLSFHGKDAEKSFDDYVKFLSKHLLRGIANEDERKFLAHTIASNSHQSGFTKAASAQYKTRADAILQGRKITDTDGNHQLVVATVAPPKSVCYMECKNGTVSFKEDARFQQVTEFKDYTKNGQYYTASKITPHTKEGQDYFAHVRSTIVIKAEKSPSDTEAKFDKIKLSGDKIFVTLNKDNKKAYKLFSRVFVDPRKLWEKVLEALIRKIPRRKIEPVDSPQPTKISNTRQK